MEGVLGVLRFPISGVQISFHKNWKKSLKFRGFPPFTENEITAKGGDFIM